jgi:tetratricopeptide (TPR) repeat protein
MKLLLVFFCLLLIAPLSFAQTDQEMALAAKRFDEGESSYRLQEYDKALEAYKAAYVLSKAPDLIYNIGQCQRLLGKYEEAITSYKTFLREVPDAPTRKNAEGFIKEMERLLASGITKEGLEKASKLVIQAEGLVQVQEYAKALDSYKEAYLLSKRPELLYNIGQCQQQLKQYEEALKSYQSFLQARPESPQRPQAEESVKQCQTLLAAAPPMERKAPRSTHLFFYGGAGVAGAGGIVVGALSLSAARDAKTQTEVSAQAPTVDTDEVKRLSKKALNFAHVSDALFVAGLASGVVGLVLSRKAKAEPAVSLSPAGVNVALHF